MSTLARVIAAREALETGEQEHALALLRDLEHDLLRRVPREHRCEECGRRFAFPGDLEHHVFEAHGWKAAA